MFGLDNPIHIAFVLVIVLLVFGAKRLPELGSSLGAGLRGFKDSISGESHHSEGDQSRLPTVTASAAAPDGAAHAMAGVAAQPADVTHEA